MSTKDIQKLIMKVDDESSWNALMEISEKKLVIVDVYSDWCGPCEAVMPTFSRLFLEFDYAEERLAIATAAIGKVGSLIQATIPSVSLEKQGCYPLFVMYRGKSVINVTQGSDAPSILQNVTVNIPDRPVKDNHD